MGSEGHDELKWEGKITATLRKFTADQVWPLLEDFFNLHKWLPSIDTCHQLDGGLIRYCAATLPPKNGDGGGVVRWCHEKLLDIDPIGKCLRYELLENNMGIRAYESTIKVLPMDGGDDPKSPGTMIEWSFLAEPVEGVSCENFIGYLDISLQGMAKNIETALESN